jgi:peptidoglycan/xylan/chitin deacetylase (PgdA/CDA1 family)
MKNHFLLSLLLGLAFGPVLAGCRAPGTLTTTASTPMAASLSAAAPNTDPIELVVTVDDFPKGPVGIPMTFPPGESWATITKRMLSAFKKFHLPPTYTFINGVNVDDETRPLLGQWVDAGHRLGSHTFSHTAVADEDLAGFQAEIERNEPLMAALESPATYKFLRFPFLVEGAPLDKRNAIRKYLAQRGYTIAQVTMDFADWDYNLPWTRCVAKGDNASVQLLERSYLDGARRELNYVRATSKLIYGRQIPHILLLHVGVFSSQMFERLFQFYRASGVTFIPLSKAIQDPAYGVDPGVASDSYMTFLDQMLQSKGLTAPAHEHGTVDPEQLCL